MGDLFGWLDAAFHEHGAQPWAALAVALQGQPFTAQVGALMDYDNLQPSGRVVVEPDLSVKGHPNVFVVGDMAAVPGVPGVAQGAIQGAKIAVSTISEVSTNSMNSQTAWASRRRRTARAVTSI